jgi:hypothetical protein
MITVRENGQYCVRMEDSRDGVIEETQAMKKIELTQPQEGCQYQEAIISILMVKEGRKEALVCFQIMWMGVVHLNEKLRT